MEEDITTRETTKTPINVITTITKTSNNKLYSPSSSPSLKQKLKSSLTCFPSPFRPNRHHHHHHHRIGFSPTAPPFAPSTPRLARTSSTTDHVTLDHHHQVKNGGGICKPFISCIGGTGSCTNGGGGGGDGGCGGVVSGGCGGTIGGGGRHRRRTLSADFKYDALSYALNFDDGGDGFGGGGFCDDDEFVNADDHFQFRSFSSRLPPSPTVAAAGSNAASGDARNGSGLGVFVG